MGEWTETTIGQQVVLQRGFDITKANQRPGPVPVVSSGGVSSYHDTAMVDGPGVVLGRKGTLGTVFYLEEPFWPHDTTLWVKNFCGNRPKFVYYFFKSISRELLGLDVGTSNPTLNRNHVHPVRTLWPSVDIQDAIACLLGVLDAKIALNRRMSQTLNETAASLFRSWFVDFDPVLRGATGNAGSAALEDTHTPIQKPFVESALGAIPSGWGIEPIGHLVRCVGGSTPSTSDDRFWSGGSNFWATPRDLAGLEIPVVVETTRKITDAGVQQIASGLLPRGTVLLSSRAPVGYIAVTAEPLAVNQGFIAMVCDRVLPNWYVLHWTEENMEAIVARANGTTFAEINKRNFRSIPALRPPPEILRAFHRVVEPLHTRIERNVRENRTLGLIRDSLLPQLLSGAISIRAAEQAVLAAC